MQNQLLGLIPIDNVFVETDLTFPNPSSSSSSTTPSSSSIPSSSTVPSPSSSSSASPSPSSSPTSSTVPGQPLSGFAAEPAGAAASFAATTTLPQVTSGWDIQLQVDLAYQPTTGRQTMRVDLEGPGGLLETQQLVNGKGCRRSMTGPFATPTVTTPTVLSLYVRSVDGTQLLWQADVQVIPAPSSSSSSS